MLRSPLRLGAITLPNRVVMAPHSTHYANEIESERLTRYYQARARGGVGLIVHEPVIVHASSRSRIGKIWGYDRRNVEAYRATTSAVHQYGAGIVCQLIHNGRQVDGYESRMPAWYPSETMRSGTGEVTHEMSEVEIAQVVEGFAQAALICAEGGFDGVEIHAAHGYLIQAFLSPMTNRRNDEYGGDLPNRMRLLHAVIAAVRAATSSDFVIGVRLAADEDHPSGMTIVDGVEVARALADEVDYFSVVSGSLASSDRVVADMSHPRALNASLAAQVKAAVAPVPVLVTGRIAEPGDAEAILRAGQADLIGLARALIADPQWLHKATQSEQPAIRPCVYANDCRNAIAGRRALQCMVNPDTGQESLTPDVVEFEVSGHTSPTRRIVVIGAGPAGLEAAVTAAENGEQVVLFEAGKRIGGQLLLATQSPARSEFNRLLTYYAERIEERGIDLRLNTRVTVSALAEYGADAIIVATGAEPVRSDQEQVRVAWDVLAGEVPTPGKVVLEDHANSNAWPLFVAAEVFARRGAAVTLVSAAHMLGSGIDADSIPGLLRRLRELEVRIELMSRVIGRDDSGVQVQRLDTGRVEHFDDAELVLDLGRRTSGSRTDWTALGLPVTTVGDALAPRRVATAIAEGREAANRLRS